MSYSDHEFINRSEDYELNDHLRKNGKKESQTNRNTLVSEISKKVGNGRMTHKEVDNLIQSNISKYE